MEKNVTTIGRNNPGAGTLKLKLRFFTPARLQKRFPAAARFVPERPGYRRSPRVCRRATPKSAAPETSKNRAPGSGTAAAVGASTLVSLFVVSLVVPFKPTAKFVVAG